MLSFAGEAGDGVIVLAGISEDAIRSATSRVTAGAAVAGRDAPKVATGLFCYVGDDWRDHLIQGLALCRPVRHPAPGQPDRRRAGRTRAGTDRVIGTASDAAKTIAQLESFGVTSLYIRGFYSYQLPAELCDRFSRDVMPLMPAASAPAT